MGKEQELLPLETLLREYDRAVEWHSYRLHDVDREAAQHRAAAKLAEAVRADLTARRSSSDEAEVVHLTADEQRIMSQSLRNSTKIVASPSGVKAGVTEALKQARKFIADDFGDASDAHDILAVIDAALALPTPPIQGDAK